MSTCVAELASSGESLETPIESLDTPIESLESRGIVIEALAGANGAAGTANEPVIGIESRERAIDTAELKALDEPVELRDDLRVLAAERPARARSEAPRQLASLAAATWRDQLAPCGIPSDVIGPTFEAARREIWLWVEGDRTWGQLGPYLAGRVARRRPNV